MTSLAPSPSLFIFCPLDILNFLSLISQKQQMNVMSYNLTLGIDDDWSKIKETFSSCLPREGFDAHITLTNMLNITELRVFSLLLPDGVYRQWTSETNLLDCCSEGHRLRTNVAPDVWREMGH